MKRGHVLAALGLALAGCVALIRFMPIIRWVVGRQTEKVADAARQRGIKVPDRRLNARSAMVRKIVESPEILAATEEHARASGVSEARTMFRVEQYAREIVPSFNAMLYFRVGIPFAGRISRALYDVRVASDEGLGALERFSEGEASVIFVMNHRSNLDYVILAHLTGDRSALTFAAGEWAGVPPIGWIVRSMGAFFVRRGSGDELYRRVLERYVQLAIQGGLTQLVFPEGSLSRDGRAREPKIGLLDYMLRRFDPERTDILFVPVAINYDWVIEDYALLQPGGPEAGLRGRGGIFASTAAAVVRNLIRAGSAGSLRLGRAALSFGSPLSMKEYLGSRNLDLRGLQREQRGERVKALANQLMESIGEDIPDAAVPLLSHALLESHEQPILEAELLSLAHSGSKASGSLDLEAALRTLVMRRLAIADQYGYRAAPGAEELLTYYANSLAR